MTPKREDKHENARKLLPAELVPIFDELVEDYKFAALKCHGRPWVSPMVIAELVLMGWRFVSPEGARPRGNAEH